MAGVFETWWNAIVAGVGSEIDGQVIRFYTDAEQSKYGQGAPPAINYRFVDDSYAPADSIRRGAGNGPDAIFTCATRIGMHVWAKTYDQAHEMRRRIIVALHTAARGSFQNYRLEGGTWVTNDIVQTNGVAYVFGLIWMIPIVRNDETTAVINAMPDDVGIQTPGS